MKFSLAAVVTAALGVYAQNAFVVNDCDIDLFLQSVPYDEEAEPGPVVKLEPGEAFGEEFRPSGSTIKMGQFAAMGKPLFFGYSFSSKPDYAYYEFSTEFGNPFKEWRNVLSPGDGCRKFDCDVGEENCYSTPDNKEVYGCPMPVNITATMCA